MGKARPYGLTRREFEVLQHVAAGKQNKEIARDLFVGERVIEAHLTNAFRKIDATNRTEAVAKVGLRTDEIWVVAVEVLV